MIPRYLRTASIPILTFRIFFDRSSGGDGTGNLGAFQVIGDIYYVTTNHNRSYYSNNGQVNYEVLQKLDHPDSFNVDFRKYDNWTF